MITFSIILNAMLGVVCGQAGYDWWWYNLGEDDSPASDYLAATSPFYNWFKTAQYQFDAYGPAFHVGKINRGTFLNSELNMPAYRAFGSDSDFHSGDLDSGAFAFTPQAQRFVAKKIHVAAGLAKKVGQITTMPIGVFVQDDGSLLVDTSMRQVDPCNPSPCNPTSGTPRCIAIGSSTAKCIGPEQKKLEFRWIDPVNEDQVKVTSSGGTITLVDQPYAFNLYIHPTNDDTSCFVLTTGRSECGVTISLANRALGSAGGKVTATLEPTNDGSTFKDYTYAIFAQRSAGPPSDQNPPGQKLNSDYNIAYTRLKLNIYGDTNGVNLPEFVYSVPQGSSINIENKSFFFFGCIRPDMKALDTRGAGFYNPHDKVRGTSMGLYDKGLCSALLTAVPAVTPGFV